MGKHEFERLKPQLWAAFAHAGLTNPANPVSKAATRADDMLKQFEQRFVGRDDDVA